MALRDRIEEDIKSALKAGEQAKLSTLRLLKNSLDAGAKDKQGELDDPEVIKIIQNQLKQRRDSIESYKQGGRVELAQKEATEVSVLEAYLPAQLNEEQLNQLIDEVIEETGASSMADMGKVMGRVNAKAAGKADGSLTSQLVRAKLSST